jgi:hypothetical protein
MFSETASSNPSTGLGSCDLATKLYDLATNLRQDVTGNRSHHFIEAASGVCPMIDRQTVETVLRRLFAICLAQHS